MNFSDIGYQLRNDDLFRKKDQSWKSYSGVPPF